MIQVSAPRSGDSILYEARHKASLIVISVEPGTEESCIIDVAFHSRTVYGKYKTEMTVA